MGFAVEYMLARMTAQSSGPNPKQPGGGRPSLTAADVSLIASHAPHMSFHALMAKYCDDRISEQKLLLWTHKTSLAEWFSNPDYAAIRIEAQQLNKLADLAVLAWIQPNLPHGSNINNRAAYVGANHETFRRNFQAHYHFLTGELGYLEALGRRAVLNFKNGVSANED